MLLSFHLQGMCRRRHAFDDYHNDDEDYNDVNDNDNSGDIDDDVQYVQVSVEEC